jgi:nucleoside-diphosphate-sugar epimerase
MRVFVTGATGFLGATIVRALVRAGEEVAGPARVDFARPDRWRDQLAGIDVAVHAAAVAPGWGPYAARREQAARAHRRLVLELVRAKVRRLVLIGTAEVYGRRQTGVLDEDAPTARSGDACTDAHLDAERIVREAHALGLIETCVLRLATCYGPGDRTFLPRIVRDLVSGRSALLGDGDAPARLCHVDHAGEMAHAAVVHPGAAGQVFHVADRGLLTWREVLARIAAALRVPPPARRVPALAAHLTARAMETFGLLVRDPAPPLLTTHVVDLLTARHTLSLARARRVLGWEPRWDTAAGLDATLADAALAPSATAR